MSKRPSHQKKTSMDRRTLVITGGAKRIGAAITRHFHAQGWNIVVHHHTSTMAAKNLANELNKIRPKSVFLLSADFMILDYSAFAKNAIDCTGRIDALINNASAYFPTPLASLSNDDWNTLMKINLKAPTFLSQNLSPWLKKHQGSIVNISDIYSEVYIADHTIYSMTKSALVTLTRLLARELAPDVRVNAIAPGAILWPDSLERQRRQEILSRIPLGTLGSPLDIAKCSSFLINEANYMTGQIITVDGGRHMTR